MQEYYNLEGYLMQELQLRRIPAVGILQLGRIPDVGILQLRRNYRQERYLMQDNFYKSTVYTIMKDTCCSNITIKKELQAGKIFNVGLTIKRITSV